MNDSLGAASGNLQQHHRLIVGALLVVCIATLALTSLRDPMAYDAFWHLQMGTDWLTKGLSPWEDHYSFTFPAAEIRSPPVLFQGLLFLFTDLLGVEWGFKIYKFAAMTLVVILMTVLLRILRAPTLVYALVLPLLVVLLQLRATVRPELLSYSLMIIAAMLYRNAGERLTARTVLPIAVLMLFWSNYHSAILGYVIFFGLFVDHAFRLLKERAEAAAWVTWLLWGLLVVAVGFLNPSVSHPAIQMLQFADEWKEFIKEYRPPLAYLRIVGLWALLPILVTTVILLARQRRWGPVIVLSVFAWNAVQMARMVTPAGILILCFFADALSKAGPLEATRWSSKRARAAFVLGAIALTLAPLITAVVTARWTIQQNQGLIGYFPEQMVDYMIDQDMSGRVLNEYEQGGYLIHRLSPSIQVYIDGRTGILYPLSHYVDSLVVLNSPKAMEQELEHFSVDLAVLKNKPEYARVMSEAGLMTLDYADVRYFLYRRGKGNFATTGLLWGKPACWSDDLTEQVGQEQTDAIWLLPPASPLPPFQAAVMGYANAEDRLQYLSMDRDLEVLSDPSKRFLGYRALEEGQYDLAYSFFVSVAGKEPKDYAAGALANLRAGDTDRAEETIELATQREWHDIEFGYFVVLNGLLREIQAIRPLKRIPEDYAERLAQEVSEFATRDTDEMVTTATFCKTFD